MEAGTSSDFSHAQTLNCFAEQYQAELLRMCCLYLRDAELAKDAVQETYLKAYRALDGLCGKGQRRLCAAAYDLLQLRWYAGISQGASVGHAKSADADPQGRKAGV